MEQADIPCESGKIQSINVRSRNTLGTGNWLHTSEESVYGKRWVGKKAMHQLNA